MLTSNIKFKNFNISKFKKFKSFKNEKWFKKIRLLESLKPNYKYSYTKKQIKKINKNKNFRLIGMGGSTLGVEAIYQFLKHKIKKKIIFLDNLDQELLSEVKKKNNLGKSLFVIISKSGNTKETIINSSYFLPYLKKLNLDNLTIASPDMGGSKRAYAYSKALESDVVICYKQRAKANVISHMELIGDVQGKNVVLVDDMVDTAGTLTKAADLMMERGAKSVRAITTHGLLSGKAYERIENSQLSELIITDSIPTKKDSSKVKVLSCADLFADVMHRVHHNTSIASKFLM